MPVWHVKLPASAGARLELHQPLGRAIKRAPAAVLAPVRGLVGTQQVGPVATVHTHRVLRRLLDADGRQLAEVADDLVTGTALPTRPGSRRSSSSWREIEVELVDGGPELLDAAGEALVAAGARLSGSSSKAAGAGRRACPAAPRRGEDDGPRPGARAAEVVLGAVGAQVGPAGADLAVRTGQVRGCTNCRVACRRLRSTLAAFRRARPGGHRPGARRAAVGRQELPRPGTARWPWSTCAASWPDSRSSSCSDLAARLQQAELADHLLGVSSTCSDLAGARYLRLVDALNQLLSTPPLTACSHRALPGRSTRRRPPQRQAALRQVRSARRQGLGRGAAHRAARGAQGGEAGAVHAEWQTRARRPGEEGQPPEMKRVQTVLGHAQDTVITREPAARAGPRRAEAGENPWTYGRAARARGGPGRARGGAFLGGLARDAEGAGCGRPLRPPPRLHAAEGPAPRAPRM